MNPKFYVLIKCVKYTKEINRILIKDIAGPKIIEIGIKEKRTT